MVERTVKGLSERTRQLVWRHVGEILASRNLRRRDETEQEGKYVVLEGGVGAKRFAR